MPARRMDRPEFFGGPELKYLQATLAHRRGDLDEARGLVRQCLRSLPGHEAFLELAIQVGAPLPPPHGAAPPEPERGHR